MVQETMVQETVTQGILKQEAAKESLPRDRIKVGWVIVRMSILVALIVLFNFFPERVGVWVSATDPDSFVSVLSPDFQSSVVWLDLWWGLALALEIAHLCLRRWHPLTRWADLALSVLAVLILMQVMLWGPILVGPPTATEFWARIGALPLRWEQEGIVLLDLLVRGGLALASLAIFVRSLSKLPQCMAGADERSQLAGTKGHVG